VLHGDPTKPGTVVLRFKFPPNRQTRPHRHPYAEYTTILSGKVYYGEGEKFDTSNPEVGKVGTFAIVPAGQAHFVYGPWTKKPSCNSNSRAHPVRFLSIPQTIRSAVRIDDADSWLVWEMPNRPEVPLVRLNRQP